MIRKSSLVAIAIATTIPAGADAQTAKSVLADVLAAQQARLAQVQNYTIEQRPESAPISAPVYYERATIAGPGEPLYTMRAVPMVEWTKEVTGTENIGAEQFQQMSDASRMAGDALRGADPIHAWSADVMYDQSTFYAAAAAAERSGAAYADENLDAAQVEGLLAFAQRAQHVGQETVAGRPAHHLHADDLSDIPLEQPDGDAEFTLRSASLWVDTEHLVPLQLAMNLDVEADGQTSPVVLETRFEDYQSFGPLYEHTRQVMSIKGLNAMMTSNPEDAAKWKQMREDMAEAQEQMKEMEDQIAQMPASVQGMMRGQMEKAMRQMEMMINEGAIETVVHRTVYAIDEGPPAGWTPTLTP